MPKLPLFVQPQAPQGPPEYIDENDPRKQTSFLDAPADFVRGLGYFPTEPLPADASKAYSAGAAVANAAPLLGPALKGLGMAAPLITIFKDAEGVPSATLRGEGTKRFVNMAANLPHRMRAAAEQFAQDYPRVAAHMSPRYGLPPESAPRASAYVNTPAGRVMEPMDTGFTHIGRYHTETPQDYETGLNEARKMMYHEGTHAAQALGNRDFNRLYDDANRLVGYDLNPFERTAERAAQRAVGPVTRGHRTAIDMLKDITALPGQGPAADRVKNIIELRESTPMQDIFPRPAETMPPSAKPSIVRPEVDLSGLPGSLDYVQSVLKESGMAPMASHEADPATRALIEALGQTPPAPDPDMTALGQKVTGLRPAPRPGVSAPEGFTFGGRERMEMSRPAGLDKLSRQIRGYYSKMGGPLQEAVGPQEPVVRALDELKDLSIGPVASHEPAPLLQAQGRGRGTRVANPNRRTFSTMTPEDIKEVQRAAGSGLNQKQLLEKYPQYTKETLRKVVAMPWKD